MSNSPRPPLAAARPRAWSLPALCLLGALAALGGCASTGSGSGATEMTTAMDDSADRHRARTRLALASSYFQDGKLEVALDEQKKAHQIDPGFHETYNLGGLIYMAMGEHQLAQANFERAISLNQRDANAMHNLGWLLCQQGQYPQAAAMFQRAVAVPTYGEKAKTLMTQGICEARGGNAKAAEDTLMKSYELDAGNPVTAFNLSQLLYNRGDYERAQFYIRRLNNSQLANAESLWLGIKVENRLKNRRAMTELASQLQRRYPSSKELLAYERGAFDE